MNVEQQKDYFDKLTSDLHSTMLTKGGDYANDDVLSNFKQVATIAGIPAQTVVMVMIGIKMARLTNLLTKKDSPNHESISDTMKDLTMYTILLNMVQQEYGQEVSACV